MHYRYLYELAEVLLLRAERGLALLLHGDEGLQGVLSLWFVLMKGRGPAGQWPRTWAGGRTGWWFWARA